MTMSFLMVWFIRMVNFVFLPPAVLGTEEFVTKARGPNQMELIHLTTPMF